MRQLLAGIARADITPPIGILHTNWGAQLHQRAAGIDFPLMATALALSDEEQTVVMVDIDIGFIWAKRAIAMRQAVSELTGLPASHIRLSYTHTHSGPVTGGGRKAWATEGTEMVGSHDESLAYHVAGAAWAAIRDLRPARVVAGTGSSDIAVNRRFQRPEDGAVIVGRNWSGPVDHEVKVIRVDDKRGGPLAAIVNYACHPTTVGPDNELITPDYPGVVRHVVEQSTGATCLFMQGAAGDVGPIWGGACNGINEYRRLGAILGHEASRVWWAMDVPERREQYVGTLESGAPLAIYRDEPIGDPDATLRVATRSMDLPLKVLPPPAPLEAELEEHLARLNALRAAGDAEEIRQETMLCKRLASQAATSREHEGQTHVTLEAQAFSVGDEIAIIGVPGEPFVEIGLGVKRGSPFKHTLFAGYSNVGGTYIPVPDAYPLGGYEVARTPYSPDAAWQIVDECLGLLHTLAGQR